MKAYVITLTEKPESVEVANRCIKTGARFGVSVEKWAAYSPQSAVEKWEDVLLEHNHIPVDRFVEKYSRFENCLAAFFSHYSLWKKCIELNEDILILEHDAVFNNFLPEVHFSGVMSFGAPSYGKYVTPQLIGRNKLISKQYLPGAHAYAVTPTAAKVLVDGATKRAAPTDLYLSNANFSFIEEYYPWPISAKDTFTTIQNETGCMAKHNNGPGYKVI